jgi:threonine/homoserine/homoserine lactone efflux protein
MSFGIYLGGIVLVLGGLIYAAAILHAPIQWIIVGALVLLGFGILTAVKATRQRDGAS